MRAGARALIVDPDDRLLLCGFDFGPDGIIWAPPGGGVEPGESLLETLARELIEEVGLVLRGAPAHVWHQVVEDPSYAAGFDGVVNDVFLVRVPAAFMPRGSLSDVDLAAEMVSAIRWWTPAELRGYAGPDRFSPRDLPARVLRLLTDGVPARPVSMGA
jgi:8-oxo-dGTP diphosphatase